VEADGVRGRALGAAQSGVVVGRKATTQGNAYAMEERRTALMLDECGVVVWGGCEICGSGGSVVCTLVYRMPTGTRLEDGIPMDKVYNDA
jgi:hypothetical protein